MHDFGAAGELYVRLCNLSPWSIVISMENNSRIDAEWVTLNAVRGVVKIAANGDLTKATYDNALEFGGELYPALLGASASILRRERESDTVKEYRQKAQLKSIKQSKPVTALALLQADIAELKDLLEISRSNKNERAKTDQLKRRLTLFIAAETELNPIAHTENQLIFRDALSVARTVPPLRSGKSFRDFELPDSSILRVRVLHPDKPEHVTGADIIYERHLPSEEKASIIVVQYKIWEDKTLLMTDPRMLGQISRLRAFTCDEQVCEPDDRTNPFRFPCCAAFLRPTDKLQRPDQSFVSTGEHIPLCRINDACSKSTRGNLQLEYKKMRDISLSSEMFEQLFNKGKIGSRCLTYPELTEHYTQNAVAEDENTVVIYVQEFSDIA